MYLRIQLGAESYALGLDHVVEVVELGEVTPVPGSGATLLGLRNLRGEILPALDLRVVLGVAAAAAPRHIVVVGQGDRRAGLAVDEVVDFSRLPEAAAAVDSAFVQRAVLAEGALVGVVDVSAVLLAHSRSPEPAPA
jgi:chemotaxis signal transduction protein